MSAYKLTNVHAQLLLTECGIPCDDPAKVKGRLESLPDMAKEPDFQQPKDGKAKRILKAVLAACAHGQGIELVEKNGTGKKHESNGKASKASKNGKAPKKEKSTNGTPGKTTLVKSGTVITKTYKGKELKVTATSEGFKYSGKEFPSLTKIAMHVTGAESINGPKFFGLRK